MKKINRRVLTALVSLLVFVFSFETVAQECKYENGTYYLFYLKTNLKSNNRPVFTTFIIREKDSLKVSTDDLTTFICSIYKTAHYIVEPPLDFTNVLIKCCNPPKDKIGKMIVDNQKKVAKMNGRTFSFKIVTKDSTRIDVDVQKFTGGLWTFKADSNSYNNVSDRIEIPAKCYLNTNYYSLKDITTSYKLSAREKMLMRSRFSD